MVILELTDLEARTLATILERIGGSPDRSLRGAKDRIADKLIKEGAYCPFGDSYVQKNYNRIYFEIISGHVLEDPEEGLEATPW